MFDVGLNQAQIHLVGTSVMLSSGDEPTFLLPGLSFVIDEFADGAVSHAGRGVAFHHLAAGILQTVFFYHSLGFRIRRKPNDITDR